MSRCRHAPDRSAKLPAAVAPVSRWALARQEPFRLFFPYGMVVGIAGVLLWPLFYAKLIPLYPNILHARWMILGWAGAMVVGFLATAGPRMLGVRRLTGGEVRMLWMVHFAAMAAFVFAGEATGCGLFATVLVLLLMMLGSRFPRRADLPPARFTLVLLGLLSGITGCALIASGYDMRGGPTVYRLARLLMDEAFLLLPALGIGAFLIPRITGIKPRRVPEEGPLPTRTWWTEAAQSLLIGVVLLGTFVAEASGHINVAMPVRVAAALGIWMLDFPRLWVAKMQGTQAWMLRLALVAMPVAWLCRWIDPVRLYAVEHVLFITGFGILMFAVASRVVDGHSGNRIAAKGPSKPLRWLYWLALLAMLTRVSADYFPQVQISHYIYAAVVWILLTAVWLMANWRKLGTADPEDQG